MSHLSEYTMQPSPETIRGLLERLKAGWTPNHCGLAHDLVNWLRKHLQAEGAIGKVSQNTLRFELQLHQLHLRGADNIHCLLVSGENPAIAEDLKKFWHDVNAPERIVIICALSESALDAAQRALGHTRSLKLSSAQMRDLMEDAEPKQKLSGFLRQQLGRMHLLPFNKMLPATSNMFFGRESELDRLFDQETSSFAIAGPSQLGKTSLVKQHEFRIRQKLDPRSACKYYLDFRGCDKTDDGITRFIALKIENSSRSGWLKTSELAHFIKVHHAIAGRPLELILDEVDEVCESVPFYELATAAHQGLCRLILCGREVLLKVMLNGNTPLKGRLELMRLRPLTNKPARQLVIEPLKDIGFIIEEEEKLVNELFALTGRMPHLLQQYGKRLAELVDDDRSDVISFKYLELLKHDYVTSEFYISPVLELKSPRSKLIALALLKDKMRSVNFPLVQGMAGKYDVAIGFNEFHEICNDLIINNILIWDDGYRIANEAIIFFAHQRGILDEALKETKPKCV